MQSPFAAVKQFFQKKPFQEAWKSFRRHTTLTFATLILIALLVFLFNVVFSIRSLTNEVFGFLSSKVDISLEVRDDVSFEAAQQAVKELEKLPQVQTIRFISKDDALDIVDQDLIPGYREFLTRNHLSNPLPASINIVTYRTSDHADIIASIKNSTIKDLLTINALNAWDDGSMTKSELTESAAIELGWFSKSIYNALFIVLILFAIAATLILINTIYLSIQSKKLEINIMHVVGAREKYITLPFLYEGMIYGLVASVLGIVSFYVVVMFGGWELFPILFWLPGIIAQMIFITALCGLTSYLLVQRYLQGKLTL